MDKAVAKAVFRAAGLPVARDVTVRPGADTAELLERLRPLGFPLVAKPRDQGSAIGVEFWQDDRPLAGRLDALLEGAPPTLIEEYIDGREITVGVLEDEQATRPLPVLEVLTPEGAWYDYEHRYTPGHSEHVVPAALDGDTSERLQELACGAHVALGYRDLSRTDFVLPAEGAPIILETNALPGMTATSLYPDAARAAGIAFPDLVARLVLRAHTRGRPGGSSTGSVS